MSEKPYKLPVEPKVATLKSESSLGRNNSATVLLEPNVNNLPWLPATHVGHDSILGAGAVSSHHRDVDRMLEADRLRQAPDLWPSKWPGDIVSHTLEELAEIHYLEAAHTSEVVNVTKDRRKLQQLLEDPYNDSLLESYLANPETAIPPMFKDWLDGDGGHSWADWLANTASDDQLLNFLQWHNFKMVELQNRPDIQSRIATQKQAYREAVEKAVAAGDLPQAVAERLGELDGLDIRVGDLFDTLMERRAGYHDSDTNIVVIEEAFIESSAIHEFNHAILGNLPYDWMREAITEYIAESMKHGFGPIVKENGEIEGEYVDEQRLIWVIGERIASANDAKYKSAEAVVKAFVTAYADESVRESILDDLRGSLATAVGHMDFLSADTDVFADIAILIESGAEHALNHGMDPRDTHAQAARWVTDELLQID